MPNASEMVAALKSLADTLHAKCNHVDTEDVILVKQAAELIRRLTSRMTLDECCEILNENKYLFDEGATQSENSWTVSQDGSWVSNSKAAHSLFKANSVARAFLLEDV